MNISFHDLINFGFNIILIHNYFIFNSNFIADNLIFKIIINLIIIFLYRIKAEALLIVVILWKFQQKINYYLFRYF